jgi:hypothetical protein
MKTKTFLMAAMLVVLVGFVGGCHYGSHDDRRDYGSRNRSEAYRDGFRDGRALERRNDNWRTRYDDRDYWRRRW